LKVGRNEPRIDGTIKATGKAEFVGDLRLPDMLYGKLLRSIHPHAKILNIKTEKARKVPGVKAIVTAQDLPDRKFYWLISDQTIFARGKVRYIGEPVAGVAAESEEAAIKAIDLIEVDYEPLPAVFDPEEAMKPDAPIIHEELAQYRKWRDNLICYGNVCCHLKYHRGDVEKGFKEADQVFEDTFTTQSVYQAYLEPKGAIASLDPDGKITIWSSTQTPFPVRFDLADALGIPISKVNIVCPFLGGGFGGRLIPI
jgi:carbon-monoxide dehydrogenase large subunit